MRVDPGQDRVEAGRDESDGEHVVVGVWPLVGRVPVADDPAAVAAPLERRGLCEGKEEDKNRSSFLG